MNAANIPVIPSSITVHLGRPNENAANVTLSFYDYIANVASSEIYPTWPENAIRANILAQISYALNRIYTEYYRARGYDFDITNSTTVDQSFVYGREIFQNINDLVGELFNSYIRRGNNVEPLFTAYCDGVIATCDGLSQWGSVELAEAGQTTLEILQNYYGTNISIVSNVPIEDVNESAPSPPLRIGFSSDAVRTAQIRLNRISSNYPNIPKIANTDGVFDDNTEDAVLLFQSTFGLTPDGIIGNATWYKILQIYNGVKRLNELTSEGIPLEDVTREYPEFLGPGDTGVGVANLQYYLNYLSQFYSTIPPVTINGVFNSETEAAVRDLQQTFGLRVDGLVGEETWYAMYNNYLSFIETIPLEYVEGITVPFPGIVLRLGSESEAVRLLQEYLNYISQFFPQIPSVTPTGYFGNMTEAAVIAFQNEFGYTPNGVVEALLWFAITSLYSDLYRSSSLGEGQYPGYEIGA